MHSLPEVHLECAVRRVLLRAKWVLVTATGASRSDVQPQRKGSAKDLVNQSHWRQSRRCTSGLEGTISYDHPIVCFTLCIVTSSLSRSMNLHVLSWLSRYLTAMARLQAVLLQSAHLLNYRESRGATSGKVFAASELMGR